MGLCSDCLTQTLLSCCGRYLVGILSLLPACRIYMAHLQDSPMLKRSQCTPLMYRRLAAAMETRSLSLALCAQPMAGSVAQGLCLFTAVFTGVNFTRDWEIGRVTVNTSYKSFSRAMVNADVGLHIGLAGVNVTLVGESWSSSQGRVGGGDTGVFQLPRGRLAGQRGSKLSKNALPLGD